MRQDSPDSLCYLKPGPVIAHGNDAAAYSGLGGKTWDLFLPTKNPIVQETTGSRRRLVDEARNSIAPLFLYDVGDHPCVPRGAYYQDAFLHAATRPLHLTGRDLPPALIGPHARVIRKRPHGRECR